MNRAALYLIIGALSGAFFTHLYHTDKARSLADAQRNAWEANNASIKASSDYWQAELDDANNREPDVIERRVYVSAPVRAADCDAMDVGASTAQYELDRASIRRLESVAASAEQQYRECSYRLRAWQDGFKGVK